MAGTMIDDPGIWRMDTFRVAPGSLEGRACVVAGPEGHHAVDVVRVRVGDRVRLIDGEGTEALARVDTVGRSEATVSLLETRTYDRADGTELTVVQALLKGRAFDEVVRRCSELGVAEIIPVATERAVGKVPEGAGPSRRDRWEAVAAAAVKQARGVFVPRVRGAVELQAVGELVAGSDASLVAWEEEGALGLAEALAPPRPRRVLLVVGPEGGLSESEVRFLTDAGCRSVGLGRRVLKADWAAAAAAAMISHELGGLLP